MRQFDNEEIKYKKDENIYIRYIKKDYHINYYLFYPLSGQVTVTFKPLLYYLNSIKKALLIWKEKTNNSYT